MPKRRSKEAKDLILRCWRSARQAFNCPVMQQTLLDVVHGRLMGGNEHALPGSRSRFIGRPERGNPRQRPRRRQWIWSPWTRRPTATAWPRGTMRPLWHRSKQEVTPAAGPSYGENGGPPDRRAPGPVV